MMLKSLIKFDAKKLLHDPLLCVMFFVGLIVVVVILFFYSVLSKYYIYLSHFSLLIMLSALFFLGLLPGIMQGLLLLDERVANTCMPLQVTPLGLKNYIIYRLLSSFVISALLLEFFLCAFEMYWPNMRIINQTAFVFLLGLTSMLSCLLIGCLPKTQLAGFSMLKISSFLFSLPLILYFPYLSKIKQSSAYYLIMVLPTYASSVILQSNSIWLYLGVVTNAVWLFIIVFFIKFLRGRNGF